MPSSNVPSSRALAGRDAGQDLDALVDRLDRVDVELPFADGLDDVGPEHQVLDVLVRDDDALGSGQALGPADVEKALDLLVDAADGLDLALLVERSGDGDVLAERQPGQAGEDGIDLGRGGAVAVDSAVGLLEGERGREGERLVLARTSPGDSRPG